MKFYVNNKYKYLQHLSSAMFFIVYYGRIEICKIWTILFAALNAYNLFRMQ